MKQKHSFDDLLSEITLLRSADRELNELAFGMWINDGKPKISYDFLCKVATELRSKIRKKDG